MRPPPHHTAPSRYTRWRKQSPPPPPLASAVLLTRPPFLSMTLIHDRLLPPATRAPHWMPLPTAEVASKPTPNMHLTHKYQERPHLPPQMHAPSHRPPVCITFLASYFLIETHPHPSPLMTVHPAVWCARQPTPLPLLHAASVRCSHPEFFFSQTDARPCAMAPSPTHARCAHRCGQRSSSVDGGVHPFSPPPHTAYTSGPPAGGPLNLRTTPLRLCSCHALCSAQTPVTNAPHHEHDVGISPLRWPPPPA